MTTAQDPGSSTTPARQGFFTLGRSALIALLLLVAAMAADTTYRSDTAPRAGETEKFDPAAYGEQNFTPKVVPEIRKRAVDVATLHDAMKADPEAAGQKYGNRAGTGPYSYAVTLTGTAGEVKGGLLPVDVPGLEEARVSVQIGPAINGTALRDAVGFIEFGQFTNQVDYADAGTALNERVKAEVLAALDPAALAGEKVTVVGAVTPLNPDLLTVTPISVEEAP